MVKSPFQVVEDKFRILFFFLQDENDLGRHKNPSEIHHTNLAKFVATKSQPPT